MVLFRLEWAERPTSGALTIGTDGTRNPKAHLNVSYVEAENMQRALAVWWDHLCEDDHAERYVLLKAEMINEDGVMRALTEPNSPPTLTPIKGGRSNRAKKT